MRRLIPITAALLIGLSACGDDGGTATADSAATASSKADTATTSESSDTTSATSDSIELTEDTSGSSMGDASTASAMFASIIGADSKAAECLGKTFTSVLGKDDLSAMDGVTADQAKKLADGFLDCGIMKQLLAVSAKEAGVNLSDKTLSCVADAAAKNTDLRDDLASGFFGDSSDSSTSDTTAGDEAMKKIAKDCGISDADLAKLDAI